MLQILTMLKKLFFPFSVLVILFISCGENKKTGETTSSNDTTTTSKEESSAPAAGAVKSNITVTIKDGPMAGTYEAVCREACTSYGIAGEKIFGNQYSETNKGPKELSSVQLIVDNVTGDKQTKEFMLTVSIGDWVNNKSTNFNINTQNGKSDGSGTLDLKYSGEKATVKIAGKSKEGSDIEVLLDANTVLTPENLIKESQK